MQNQPDFKTVFEEAILELCQKLPVKDIKRLDTVLIQSTSPIETIHSIVSTFPQFTQIFERLLNQYLYASN